MAGMNSARGTAALAMAELIFDDRARAVFFLPYLERLVQDPSLAVRSCAAEALTATLNYDRDLAVSLFLHLCEADDVLLGTHSVERFLHYASYTHYGQILPVLERELGSENPKAVSSGARLACLNALLSDEALPLARRCLNGTDGQRDSAAQVFAVNLGTASNRTLCEQGLRQLFHDDSGMVREKAAACFSHLETNQVGAFVDVVDAFVASPSFLDKPFFILQALKETTAKLPDITCSVCERFLDHASGQVRDVQHHALADASTIGELVIRTYSQSTDAGIQKRCLDIIDRLTKLSAYSVQQALTLLDR